jgi:Putative MetA-pathway of phenol degradation
LFKFYKMNKLNFLFLLILISQFSIAQSPWTKDKGKAYLQLGATSLIYNKIKFEGKQVDLNSNITDITTQFYSEYGITNNLETQVIIPFKIINVNPNLGDNQSLSGIGNVTLGLKYKFYDKNLKISGGLFYSANSIAKDENKQLSTGFNSSTILPYVSIGSSSGKWYYFGNLGYGYMNNNYSDFLKISAEIGNEIIEKGHLILVLDNRIIVSKESAFINKASQWGSYYDRQSYSAVGFKFNYEFKKDKFGFNFAAIGAFALDNAPAAPTLNFGAYIKL